MIEDVGGETAVFADQKSMHLCCDTWQTIYTLTTDELGAGPQFGLRCKEKTIALLESNDEKYIAT